MNDGKGIGPAPIFAVALVSTLVTILLDHLGVTTWVQGLVSGAVKGQ